jgi:hypothetical protein
MTEASHCCLRFPSEFHLERQRKREEAMQAKIREGVEMGIMEGVRGLGEVKKGGFEKKNGSEGKMFDNRES